MITPVFVALLSTRRNGAVGTLVEQALPRTEHERMDQQHDPVDQPVRQQRANELAAAQDHDVVARLLTQPGDGVDRVALEQVRVLPWERFRERARRHVLERRVEHGRNGLSGWPGQTAKKSS